MVEERETGALREFLADQRDGRMVSSALVRTELRRATLRFSQRADLPRAQAQVLAQDVTRLLESLDLVRLTSSLLDRAGSSQPPQLRSLDAIHLVTALAVGTRLRAVVAYDTRLLDAARDAGLAVMSP